MAAILKLRRKWPSARIKAIDCATYTHRLFGRFAEEFPEYDNDWVVVKLRLSDIQSVNRRKMTFPTRALGYSFKGGM